MASQAPSASAGERSTPCMEEGSRQALGAQQAGEGLGQLPPPAPLGAAAPG